MGNCPNVSKFKSKIDFQPQDTASNLKNLAEKFAGCERIHCYVNTGSY